MEHAVVLIFGILVMSLIVLGSSGETEEKFSDVNHRKYAFFLGTLAYGLTSLTKTQGGWWLVGYLGHINDKWFWGKKLNWDKLQIELYTPLFFLGRIRKFALKKMLNCIQYECSIIYYDSVVREMENSKKWFSSEQIEEYKTEIGLNQMREIAKNLNEILN